MPENSPVARMKKAIIRDDPNMPIGSAIAIAQKKTGLAYATGKPPMGKPSPASRMSKALKKKKKPPK